MKPMKKKIPFNKPFIIGNEIDYVRQAVDDGHISGDGAFTRKCQSFLETRFSAHQLLLTTSCTSALEMAAFLCNLTKGDEIILPSYTFVSTANAFLMRGAKLVFVDVTPDTMNIDESLIEGVITQHTKAIVPVHYAGISCDMDSIMDIARKKDLLVIEDAAQGVNAKYKGSYLGTIGDLGTYSFHETKNYICGEGGALVINDDEYSDRSEILREKGTNRSKFFRGEIDKYTWVDEGSSYVPSDILAAFLYAQLEHMDIITDKRRKLYNLYYELLRPLEENGIISLPVIPDYCESNYHMFYVVLESNDIRKSLIDHMKNEGISAVFHYVPLHTSPMGRSMGYTSGTLPVTENMSERLLRLPFYYELKESDVRQVVASIFDFFSQHIQDQNM